MQAAPVCLHEASSIQSPYPAEVSAEARVLEISKISLLLYFNGLDLNTLRTTCLSLWTPIKIAPEHRKLHACFYACGGTDGQNTLKAAEFFEASTGDWQALPQMNAAKEGAICAAVAGGICTCGGEVDGRYSKSAEFFDPVLCAWVALPSMSAARTAVVSAVISGQLYVCGGLEKIGDSHRHLKLVERMDIKKARWDVLPKMKSARAFAAGSVIADNLYVVGGTCGPPLRTAECFDPALVCWKKLPAMQHARQNPIACVHHDSLYICGGRVPQQSLSRALSCVERFNTSCQRWENMPSMSRPCYNDLGVASGVFNERLYIFGASNHNGIMRGTLHSCNYIFQVFDPKIGRWTEISRRSFQCAHVQAKFTGHHFYVCGGVSIQKTDLDNPSYKEVVHEHSERFDLHHNCWDILPPMHHARAG